MKKILLFLSLLFIGINCTTNKDQENNKVFKIVVLGSSTAAGTGPKTIDSAWVNLLRVYVQDLNSQNEVINLAKGGYTTYHILPNNSKLVNNRPKPDENRNITKALSHNPDIIVVNLPSNDAAYKYKVFEQMINFSVIDSLCSLKNINLLITTAQPRNFSNAKRLELIQLNKELYNQYNDRIIDFWTDISNMDGTINPKFNSGDGVHLNGIGHKILFERVKQKLKPYIP